MQSVTEIDPTRHALFLDFDGTLVEFVDVPSAVRIRQGALDSLLSLQDALSGALAIVSGRRIEDLDRFLAPLQFAAAGVHGLQLRRTPDDPIDNIAVADDLADIRRFLEDAVRRDGKIELEDKGTALVLHFRTAPERAEQAASLMAQAVGGRDDLTVMRGNAIVEVHPAGMDKGAAVSALMASPPFAGRVPIYVGDDTTDEFAFAALDAWNGTGIKVGSGATAARERLPDVRAVEAWLASARGQA